MSKLGLGNPTLKDQILEMLKTCYDPEIPFNIVDLGLIYDLKVNLQTEELNVKMTLTSPGCPVGPWLVDEVRNACLSIVGIKKVNVEIVFEPPWSVQMMSEEAHKALGM